MSILPINQSVDAYDAANMPASHNVYRSTRRNGGGNTEDQAAAQDVRKLKDREQKVRAHENAHKSAGGPLAGTVSYTYTRGPDGKVYITGGEVSIDVSEENSPEATVRKMEQVKAAALAPADPSPQDQSVAARAGMIAMKAEQYASKLKEGEVSEGTGITQSAKVEDEEDTGRDIIKHISVYA